MTLALGNWSAKSLQVECQYVGEGDAWRRGEVVTWPRYLCVLVSRSGFVLCLGDLPVPVPMSTTSCERVRLGQETICHGCANLDVILQGGLE